MGKKIIAGLFILSVLVGLFLRVYKVQEIPPALSWDEVSIGYNAYSMLQTGRDEHGAKFPLTAFAAYGDYKPVVPVYLTAPFVALFGLNEFSVRLPSVIAGVLTIMTAFGIAGELFGLPIVSLLVAWVLAISPWHIQLSRAGFEANIAVFFITLGVWLILRAKKIPVLWMVGWIPFVIAANTFNSARYFMPFLALGLVGYSWPHIRKNLKVFALSIVLAAVLAAPLVPYLLSPAARLRFAEVNIFSDVHVVEVANKRMAADGNSIVANMFHNRRLGYAREYLVHFFDNLQPWFLFIRGDGNPKFSLQDTGQMYLVELPLLLLGIYFVFRDKKRVGWLLLYWLIAAIVPAAVARETPHALRIENSLPTWQIFIGYGIYTVVKEAQKRWKGVLIATIIFLYAFFAAGFLHNYFGYYPIEYSGEWQYGYREAIRFVNPLKNSYDQIVITDDIGRPYMYTLFYTTYNPEKFRKTVDGSFDAAGLYNVYGFDKYRFVRGGEFGEVKPKTLYVMTPANVPGGVRILDTVKLLNGNPALVIFDKP